MGEKRKTFFEGDGGGYLQQQWLSNGSDGGTDIINIIALLMIL